MSSILMHRVFVYGTLKNSQPNNYLLNDSCHGVAQLIGKGITKSLYPLVVACRYNIPFLLPFEGKGKVRSNLGFFFFINKSNILVCRCEFLNFTELSKKCKKKKLILTGTSFIFFRSLVCMEPPPRRIQLNKLLQII